MSKRYTKRDYVVVTIPNSTMQEAARVSNAEFWRRVTDHINEAHQRNAETIVKHLKEGL